MELLKTGQSAVPRSLPAFANPLIAQVWHFWFANQIPNTDHNDIQAHVNPHDIKYKFHHTLWFHPTSHLVDKIRAQFEPLVQKATQKELHKEWNRTTRGRLALILLLDQFARHLYKDTVKEFECSALALELAQEGLQLHLEAELAPVEALFFCMPLINSEKLDLVRVALDGVSQSLLHCHHVQLKPMKGWRIGILNHINVLERFGRYPHRNAALGRKSTPEEEAFLKNPDVHLSFVGHKKKEPKPTAQTTPSPEFLKPRLRILALHGFRQNGDMFRKGLRRLRHSCESLADFVWVTSPMSAIPPEDTAKEVTASFQRAWWLASADFSVYQGCAASLAFIETVMKEQGPFDGVLGFSQGGALTALVAAMKPRFDMQFVICISAFAPRAAAHEQYMKPASIHVPSLHIYGRADVMTLPERSRHLHTMFDPTTAKLVEHTSGHFTPQMWPYEAIVDFLKQFEPRPNTNPLPLPGAPVPAEAQSPLAFAIALVCAEPQLSPEALLHRMNELALQNRFAELLAIAEVVLSIRNGIALPSTAVTLPKYSNAVLDSIHQHIIDRLTEQFRADLRSAAAILKQCPQYAQPSKANERGIDLERLGLLLSAINAGDSQYHPAQGDLPVSGEATPLVPDMLDSWPSSLAQVAPRLSYRLDKTFRLGKSIALGLFPLSHMTAFIQRVKQDGKPPTTTAASSAAPALVPKLLSLSASGDFDGDPDANLDLVHSKTDLQTLAKHLSYQRYSQATSILCQLLSKRAAAILAKQQLLPQNAPTRVGELTLDLALEFLAQPIPGQVVDPEPEPVVPCALEELEPLLQHLRVNADVPFQTAFEKGTLTTDGRLDLCKQVVGPVGIRPLLDAMNHTNHVQRLLLGNNIVSDTGAFAIAEFIRQHGEKSPLDCWYIGGNRFGPEGMQKLCGVLETDKRVNALWLKRNPLRPAGMIPMAKMLRVNSTLQVLDLVNCGILDAGLQTLLEALMGANANCTLKHLYVGTNGITAASGPLLEDYLANHCKLESLFLSCNRLADLGAEYIAAGLAKNSHVQRVSLASNLIGPRGAAALAQALVRHPSLQLLDLGFIKSTAAVGEHGNFVGDDGAAALAAMLLQNDKLASLSLLHNYISQVGLTQLLNAMEHNRSITSLHMTQFGRTHSDNAKSALKAFVDRNVASLSREERARLSKLEFPDHVNEIYSVYRTAH